ncbi:MAG: hypothetical protein JSS83_01855 [Cyanobacteria bacterium SZAS LIN-3]|nr:hypothetical protein [Cyanobacteria bacterium SZAS LIN-3]
MTSDKCGAAVILDEYKFLTEELMPFLKENWDKLDLAERDGAGDSDGRLSKEELQQACDRAQAAGREEDARLLNELIMRYEAICKAYTDSACGKNEDNLGISQADVSVYAQLWDPNYRQRAGKPNPTNWVGE